MTAENEVVLFRAWLTPTSLVRFGCATAPKNSEQNGGAVHRGESRLSGWTEGKGRPSHMPMGGSRFRRTFGVLAGVRDRAERWSNEFVRKAS